MIDIHHIGGDRRVRHIVFFVLIAITAGCAPSSEKTPASESADSTVFETLSGDNADATVKWTKIERSDLDGATPIAVLSKAEFVEYLAREAGLPTFEANTDCDKAIVELKDLGFELSSVSKKRVEVNLPAHAMTYGYKFSGKPCSKTYRTR